MLNLNVFSESSCPLTKGQELRIKEINAKAQELLILFAKVVEVGDEFRTDPRCLAIAQTNLEQTVMWAIKGYSKRTNNIVE